VANFFPSIRKATLYAMLMRYISHPELRWLTQTLLFHDPTTNYLFHSRLPGAPGPGSPHYPVPAPKSLFGKRNEHGLPIGNLTSQFWGNVYPHPLDQFVKRTLKCRHYLRYVDDMVLLASDRATLVSWSAAIAAFLREHLHLAMRPDMTTPFSVRRGIDFVGWKTWWNRRLPRRRTLGNVRARLQTFERAAVRSVWDGVARRIDLQRQDTAGSVARLQATLASYAGHLRHGTTWHAWEAVWQRYPWLSALYTRQGWQLGARWSQHGLLRRRGFQGRYWHLARRAGDDVLLFFPCGRFIEFFGPQRTIAASVLGLWVVARPRASYAFTAGFPMWLAGVYTSRAVRQGLIVVQMQPAPTLVGQGGTLNLPCAVWIPALPELNTDGSLIFPLTY
jgi:RNA-directed DNA polymerase